jgi:hypothetical protein
VSNNANFWAKLIDLRFMPTPPVLDRSMFTPDRSHVEMRCVKSGASFGILKTEPGVRV